MAKKKILFEPKDIVLGISFNQRKQVLINLNRCSNGGLEWRLPGGKIEGSSPEETLIREFQEEIGRNILIIGEIGKCFHKDSRGSVCAHVFRIQVQGDLKQITSCEKEIIKCQWLSQGELPRTYKKIFNGEVISPLSWKILYSIRGMDPWSDKTATYHTYLH